ncbi:MBL fold metallo-hydrolase [Arcicella sp. LKC2W]|uniref:MBL fold metallo-hydrolase n=1 Tax=Arcicella sp. LKC2W TaxID=2984198 RepID=UPI002B1FC5D3|nr:MBL fold metallo-hydrolase [Arcicella sp. LKC2W]MEA5460960.1 MBL fold metallo-hydrolase [Arcicella sp. LKC2W]
MKKSLYALVAVIFLTISCKEAENSTPPNEIQLSEALNSVAGNAQAIQDYKTVSFKVDGMSYEYEQDIPSLPTPLVSNKYIYECYSNLSARKLKMDYSYCEFNQPAYYETSGPNVFISDRVGSQSDQYIWKSYYFNEVTPVAMFSTEIEAHLKVQMMSNPLQLLKVLLSKNKETVNTKNLVLSFSHEKFPSIVFEVFFDKDTKLPTKVSTDEVDFLQGNVKYEVVFKNWTKVNGIQYPTTLEHYHNKNLLRKETISNIKINPSFSDSFFNPEVVNDPIPYDDVQSKIGVYNSQFIMRWNAWNLGWPEPVNDGAVDLGTVDMKPYKMEPQYVSPTVKIIGRPDNRLWNVAIKTSGGLYLVDTPLNQDWTRSLIDAAKKAFNENNIKGIISTHCHHDHFAGIREGLTETGNIYLAEESVPFLKKVTSADHSLNKDKFATNPKPLTINPVKNVTVLENGKIEIHRLNATKSSATPHSSDMLIVYLPEEEIIIQADQLWSGTFMKVWGGYTPRGFTEKAKVSIKNNSQYLLDYIKEKNLKVSKIISQHGGLGSVQDLYTITNTNK